MQVEFVVTMAFNTGLARSILTTSPQPDNGFSNTDHLDCFHGIGRISYLS